MKTIVKEIFIVPLSISKIGFYLYFGSYFIASVSVLLGSKIQIS
jgi:hypothetical protein